MDAPLIAQALPLIAACAVLGAVIYSVRKRSSDNENMGAGVTPGFQGWLLLLAIGVILSPLRLLIEISGYYGNPDISLALREFPIAIYTEAGLNAALLISALATAMLMFMRKKEFRIAFYIQYFINVISLPLSFLTTTVALHRRGLEAQLFDEEGMVAVARWVAVLVIGGLWVAYVAKSRRVAVTFVR